MIKKKDLIIFEEEIKKIYEAGKIKAPIHLSGNNEDKLIKIFRKIKIIYFFFEFKKIFYINNY